VPDDREPVLEQLHDSVGYRADDRGIAGNHDVS
jgi:hypothetical protein